MSPVKLAPAKSASAPSLSLGGGLADADPATKALSELEFTVNASARRYNELKIAAEKKTEQLKQLKARRPTEGGGVLCASFVRLLSVCLFCVCLLFCFIALPLLCYGVFVCLYVSMLHSFTLQRQ